MDLAEFVSDYIQMLKDADEKIPPRRQLSKEISDALLDRGVIYTPTEVEYYLV
jgi:hypothetical protein